jgi:hypothetical protein
MILISSSINGILSHQLKRKTQAGIFKQRDRTRWEKELALLDLPYTIQILGGNISYKNEVPHI